MQSSYVLDKNAVTRLFELQHEIWPGWSSGENGATDAMKAMVTAVGLISGASILDLGCGVGREIVALNKMGFEATGVELSAKIASEAKFRVEELSVTVPISIVQGDYQSYIPEKHLDLVMFWDSSLNLFDQENMYRIICRYKEFINPGGAILIGQLAKEYFYNIDETYVIENPDIGPGKTIRRYVFDKPNDCLLDKVTHKLDNDHALCLPVQKLHLLFEEDIRMLLDRAGYINIKIIGSREWGWNIDGTSAIQDQWRMLYAVGYV